MREKIEIRDNITAIQKAMDIISTQINLVETEYQDSARELTGNSSDTFSEITLHLNDAWDYLNSLLHCELDLIH